MTHRRTTLVIAMLALATTRPAHADDVSDLVIGLKAGVHARARVAHEVLEDQGYDCLDRPPNGASVGCYGPGNVMFVALGDPIEFNAYYFSNHPRVVCDYLESTLRRRRGRPDQYVDGFPVWLVSGQKALMVGMQDGRCTIGVGLR